MGMLGLSLGCLGLGLIVVARLGATFVGGVLAIFGALTLLFALPFGIWVFVGIVRCVYLVRSGLPASAEVVARIHVPEEGHGCRVDIRYAFITSDGRRVENSVEGAEEILWRYDQGDHFTVLYDPRRPHVNQVYDASVIKAVSVPPPPSTHNSTVR